MDYEAIDLAAVVNARDDVEVPGVEAWRGDAVLRGVPFVFAERDGETRVLRVEPGEAATVPVESRAAAVRTVTFAHRTGEPMPCRVNFSSADCPGARCAPG